MVPNPVTRPGLSEGTYSIQMRLWGCKFTVPGFQQLRGWVRQGQGQSAEDLNGSLVGVYDEHDTGSDRVKRWHWPPLTVLDSEGTDITDSIRSGDRGSLSGATVDLLLKPSDTFQFPISGGNSSNLLPAECSNDLTVDRVPDPQCQNILRAFDCEPKWTGCGSGPAQGVHPQYADGLPCTTYAASGEWICPPSSPNTNKTNHGCLYAPGKVDTHGVSTKCPHRCSETCKSKLYLLDNNPPGCRLCTEDEVRQFQATQFGTAQGTCHTSSGELCQDEGGGILQDQCDQSCDAGYCGAGSCPVGAMGPKASHVVWIQCTRVHSNLRTYFLPLVDSFPVLLAQVRSVPLTSSAESRALSAMVTVSRLRE
jgi:hypothetical protein